MQILIDVFNGMKVLLVLVAGLAVLCGIVIACTHVPWVGFPIGILFFSWLIGWAYRSFEIQLVVIEEDDEHT